MGVNCIQTLIASDNGGGVGGAVYFDVTVASTPIEITGLQLALIAANPLNIQQALPTSTRP